MTGLDVLLALVDTTYPDLQADSDMPTRNISLTSEQDAFVESVLKAGEYQNASEAVREALRVLQQRRQEDALKLKALRAQIKAGVDALERGDFVEHATTHRNALWFSRRSEKVPREQKGGQEPAVVKCSPRKTRLPAKGSGRRPMPQKDTRGITA